MIKLVDDIKLDEKGKITCPKCGTPNINNPQTLNMYPAYCPICGKELTAD